MSGVFVTATGTDVGKTYVTAGLVRAMRRAGRAVDAFKPVLSGFDARRAAESDAGALLAALERPITRETLEAMSPWRFREPLSPDMAAAADGRRIDVHAVLSACRAAVAPDHVTFIEGVGGVMVPLDDRTTVLDVAAALQLPVILVSATALGAISHLLTARAVLLARGLTIVSVVLNESPGSTVPLQATCKTLSHFCDEPLHVLSRDATAAEFDALLGALAL